MSLYPLLLDPALHVKVWGGRKLDTVMHKHLPTDEPYGESWEMHDTARVANGPLAGRMLSEVLREYGRDLVGPQNDPAQGLPLLAKFLDARDWLSVQVHPDDEQARLLEGEPRGKTEAWYVIDAEAGARLVIGVDPGTSRDEMAQAIENHTLEDVLVYANVVAGDVLYVRAGTVHALGPGLLIYEIQQSSDTTYRLYDWGRLGLDGKPRAMHIDKGTQVSNLEMLPEIVQSAWNDAQVVDVVSAPYFNTRLYQLNETNGMRLALDTDQRRFHILTCIDGTATILSGAETLEMVKGQTVLVPACLGDCTLEGPARLLCSYQPA
jgi:mannose-6-phosphate isomerase